MIRKVLFSAVFCLFWFLRISKVYDGSAVPKEGKKHPFIFKNKGGQEEYKKAPVTESLMITERSLPISFCF